MKAVISCELLVLYSLWMALIILPLRTDNGNSVKVNLLDNCPGCTGYGDIDVSRATFAALADPQQGLVELFERLYPNHHLHCFGGRSLVLS